MTKRLLVACFLLVILSIASTASGGSKAPAVAGCKGGPGDQTVATKSYKLVLRIGMEELMYTPAQVKKMHPKKGEVMLRGTMGMGGMQMGGSTRHLEVQICSSKTSAVLADLDPTIVVTDDSVKGMHMSTKVPVAVMQGVDSGPADLHYGNNIAMAPGHHFTVKVTVNGEVAVFHVTIPKHG